VVYADERVYLATDQVLDPATGDRSSAREPEPSRILSVAAGCIYNWKEIQSTTNRFDRPNMDEEVLAALYAKRGTKAFSCLDGKFALGFWDRAEETLTLVRDPLGLEPVYFYEDATRFVFASTLAHLFVDPSVPKRLNLSALAKFLMFNYNPGVDTFYQGVQKLRPGHFSIVNRAGMRVTRYWNPTFVSSNELREDEVIDRLRDYLKQAVEKRMDGSKRPGVFVSGGLDSSTVLALTSQLGHRSVHTFSYRCRADSFDESHYANYMANAVGAIHHELEYRESDVLKLVDVVKEMNEPFCDAGINIATHLLGLAAQGEVDYILTGDGGDELFGGHPIYEADKISRWIDPIPSVIKTPVLYGLSQLPDSDKKKTALVKLKRFAESLKYPADLLSHRWRVYYDPKDLKKLLSPDVWEELKHTNLYEDMFAFAQEADGQDPLSRSLYSDYQTVVDFYLRRNDLNRSLGLENHYPLLDRELVDFCAALPSRLKINGWFDTKYVLKKAGEGLLPERILHRKDKLGHSIPMKNWIREPGVVQEFVLGTVSDQKKRGLFQSAAINKMVKDHLEKKHNHSHRLWSLTVLEAWLSSRFDRNDTYRT
jgi:asparagine synthase (glutamine-hydrolysing)